MNIHSRDVDKEIERSEAQAALDVLRSFIAEKGADALDGPHLTALRGLLPAAYPELSREFPDDFVVDAAYRDTLPDLQNGPSSLIRGENRVIQHVGISNFRLPISFATKAGGSITLETSVTGTVSLEADKKGINMSRIMRSFYKHAEERFSFDVVSAVLDDYKSDLESF